MGVGDKGNSLGSAGASNYSGDGKGGQVNMNSVGGKTGNVLKKIDGKWTVVSKNGVAKPSGSKGIVPTAAPPIKPAPPAVAKPVPSSSYFGDIASYAGTAAAPPTVYANSMPGNSNPDLNYGPGTESIFSNSMPGNSDRGINYGPGTQSPASGGISTPSASGSPSNNPVSAGTSNSNGSYEGPVKYNSGGQHGTPAKNAFSGYPTANNAAYEGTKPTTVSSSAGLTQSASDKTGSVPSKSNSVFNNSMPGNADKNLNYGAGSDPAAQSQTIVGETGDIGAMGRLSESLRTLFSMNPDLPAPKTSSIFGADRQPNALTDAVLGESQPVYQGDGLGIVANVGMPSEEGQIYSPAALDRYGAQPKQIVDRVPQPKQIVDRVPQRSAERPADVFGHGYGLDPLGDPERFSYGPKRDKGSVLTGVEPDVLSKMLDAQSIFGGTITPTSGFRDPLMNKNAKGVSGSTHMSGKAIDFAIPDTVGDDTARLISAMKQAGFTGIGAYRPGKVHGDIGNERVWGPDTHRSSISQLPQNMQDAMYSGAPSRANLADALAPIASKAVDAVKSVPGKISKGFNSIFAPETSAIPIPRQKPAVSGKRSGLRTNPDSGGRGFWGALYDNSARA